MNMNSVFIFALGGAVGSIVTWKLLKTKYEKLAENEIDSMREYISRKEQELIKRANKTQPDASEEEKQVEEEYTEIDELEDRITELGYKDYSNPDTKKKKGGASMTEPYVITPEEFSDQDDYTVVSLTYYADGVLTDDWDNPIEDVEGMIGSEALGTFGKYEDDSVYVRDDHLKIDYEILSDTRNYADAVSNGPSPSEAE